MRQTIIGDQAVTTVIFQTAHTNTGTSVAAMQRPTGMSAAGQRARTSARQGVGELLFPRDVLTKVYLRTKIHGSCFD